jgi:hypothetical protein
MIPQAVRDAGICTGFEEKSGAWLGDAAEKALILSTSSKKAFLRG